MDTEANVTAGSWPYPAFSAAAQKACLVLGVGSVAVFYLIAFPGGWSGALGWSAMYLLLMACASAFAFIRGAARPDERRGWMLMGVSHAILALSQVPDFLPASGLGRVLPLIRLAGGLLLVLAVLAWPLGPSNALERRRRALDGAIFAVALFFILWAVAWGDLYRQSREPVIDRLLGLAFPLLYDLLTGICIYSGARNPALFRGPLGWITIGALLSFVRALLWGALFLHGGYHNGDLADGLSLLIPIARILAPLSSSPVGGPQPANDARPATALGDLLPYLPLFPALGIGMHFLLKGHFIQDAMLQWTALLMVALLLGRQYLAVRDLRRFSRTLEARVQERTRDLEASRAALLRTQKLNVMGTLGAGVAHDLNNLVGAICNLAELAGTHSGEGDPNRQADLAKIQSLGWKAAELTSHIMEFGRAKEGVREVFDLGRQLHSLNSILVALVPRGVTIQLGPEPGPLPVLGERLQFEQILVNLVMNARDAMPQGGSIRLSAAAGPRLQDGRPSALLRVEDAGTGMPREVLERIFDPFFTTKERGEGTGLGLASVKAIMEAWGGAVAVDSREGQGTVFSLAFPLEQG